MNSLNRRVFVVGLAGLCGIGEAAAHTLYGQWVTYRRKHLLIGCHRKDPETYVLAKRVVAELSESLPAAKARPARAPRPERLASLLGTDQIDVAILSEQDASAMSAGQGRFSPYGALPLRLLSPVGKHLLLAHARFPERHAWALADALFHHGAALKPAVGDALDWHPGVVAWSAGLPQPQDGSAD